MDKRGREEAVAWNGALSEWKGSSLSDLCGPITSNLHPTSNLPRNGLLELIPAAFPNTSGLGPHPVPRISRGLLLSAYNFMAISIFVRIGRSHGLRLPARGPGSFCEIVRSLSFHSNACKRIIGTSDISGVAACWVLTVLTALRDYGAFTCRSRFI